MDAIGIRWQSYVKSRRDSLALGVAKVEFSMNAQGEAENVKVISNTSNQDFATLCIQAVEDAIPPAMPAEVLADAKGKPLQMSIMFTYYEYSPTPSIPPGNSKPAGASSSLTPAPAPSSTPPTKREGTIANRESKPLALPTTQPATPIGRYKKSLIDAIGSRWSYYVKSRRDTLANGSTKVEFRVNAQGEAENVKVVSNTSNQAFATMCIQAVEDTTPPAMTAEVLADAKGKPLDMSINFTLYPMESSPAPSIPPRAALTAAESYRNE